jgi:2-keto-4-pentenoate hydratase
MTVTLPPEVRADLVAVLAALHAGAPLTDEGAALLARFATDDVAEGERLQIEVADAQESAGEPIGGFKIGWTSRKARATSGAGGLRPFGYILAGRMPASGSSLDLARIPGVKLEPEIALRLGTDLGGPDVTAQGARAAVAEVAPAFEIMSYRLRPGSSVGLRIANGLNNWGMVVGPGRPVEEVDQAGITVSVHVDGDSSPLTSGDAGPETVDDVFTSLATMASYRYRRFGRTLRAGQVLLTGSLVPSFVMESGRHYAAHFAGLGTVAVTGR